MAEAAKKQPAKRARKAAPRKAAAAKKQSEHTAPQVLLDGKAVLIQENK